MLDFSPRVRSFSAQPFWLLWGSGGKTRRHAPDFFVRLAGGGGVVVDVRADDRIAPEDAEAFEVTAAACELVGWGYRRVGALDPVLAANVRWLAGYRHPRCLRAEHRARRPGRRSAWQAGDLLRRRNSTELEHLRAEGVL